MHHLLKKYSRVEIDEYLFDIAQDKLSAERQLEANRKILEECRESLKLFEEMLETAQSDEDIKEWNEAILNNRELREMTEHRISILENAWKELSRILLHLST